VRTVWVSFDVIGLRCALASAEVGADVAGVVTLPGPVDPDRSGQCSFDDVAERLGAELVETADINADATVEAVRALAPESIFVVGWSQLVREPFISTASNGTGCIRCCCRGTADARRFRGRSSAASRARA